MTYPNWFASTAQTNFEQILTPLAGREGIHCLQLGAFTGDASVWLAQHILTGKYSTLMDVDTWAGSDEQSHAEMDFSDVRATYLSKVEPYSCIHSRIMSSTDYLIEYHAKDVFDFIYIDADHTSAGVFLDAELSWRKLKAGGIMAFDDYTWQHESGRPALAPKGGIHMFLDRHAGEYEVLAVNLQYWIKRK